MPVPLHAGSTEKFFYTDDFGKERLVTLKDYIGDAGSLVRYDPAIHEHPIGYGRLHLRHLKIRSLRPDTNGKKLYKDIPVQEDNPLWTGPLGQRLQIAGADFEVIRKVEEVEYGVKGAAERRRAIRANKKLARETS
ncbi:MAG: hypothetical protein JST89_20490 [Cyanobacteria bacterium SZAS-4]|nr:hypothetical protein [Cyanobacteria bacterium SZAS-4]